MITIDDVLDVVSEYTGVDKSSILGRSRYREVMRARHLFVYLAVEHTGRSVSELGRFCNKDHTTIIHSVKLVSDLIETNNDYYYSTYVNLYQIISKKYKEGNIVVISIPFNLSYNKIIDHLKKLGCSVSRTVSDALHT